LKGELELTPIFLQEMVAAEKRVGKCIQNQSEAAAKRKPVPGKSISFIAACDETFERDTPNLMCLKLIQSYFRLVPFTSGREIKLAALIIELSHKSGNNNLCVHMTEGLQIFILVI
jgi:hypothetical protein